MLVKVVYPSTLCCDPWVYKQYHTEIACNFYHSYRTCKIISETQISMVQWLASHIQQFPHLAIAVSPRMEVKSSGHAWLDGCNFQRKRLLAPTQCHQRHSVRTEMMREIYTNSSTTTTLYFFLWNDFCNPSRVLIMQLLFLMKLHSFTDKPTSY